MKKIALTQNKFALVDDEDFNYLNQWKWHYISSGYAGRREYFNDRTSRSRYILMHRQLLKAKRGFEVDHIDMNRLNNQRNNLRIVTSAQNKIVQPLLKTNTSGYKGVVRQNNNRKKPWKAQISVQEKCVFLGGYSTKEDAALAYNEAAKRYFGEVAYQNHLGGTN